MNKQFEISRIYLPCLILQAADVTV